MAREGRTRRRNEKRMLFGESLSVLSSYRGECPIWLISESETRIGETKFELDGQNKFDQDRINLESFQKLTSWTFVCGF